MKPALRLGVIGHRGQAGLWALAAGQAQGWTLGSCYHPQQRNRWAEFLRESDAVVVASPTSTHLEYLRRLSKSYRRFVLVEKPAVASLEECRRLMRDFPSSFLNRISVAHNWRFYPWVEKLREILLRDSDQPILAADFHLTHDFGLKRSYTSSWRSQKESHPVGPAETQGIHWIDLVHHLFGPIEWISGGVRRAGRAGSAPDTASIFLRTRSGIHCSIHTSYVAPVAYYARVVTSGLILTYCDGILQMQRQPPPKEDRLSQPAARRTLVRASLEEMLLQPLVCQLNKLRTRMKNPARCSGLVSLREGMANIAALEGFARSLRRGRAFPLGSLPLYGRLAKISDH